MVERATEVIRGFHWTPGEHGVREALEAALEPYLERRNGERRATAGVNGSAPHSAQEGQNKAPEIFVSDGMELAGQNAANADAVYFWNTTAARVYRAMEAQRRKEQGQ